MAGTSGKSNLRKSRTLVAEKANFTAGSQFAWIMMETLLLLQRRYLNWTLLMWGIAEYKKENTCCTSSTLGKENWFVGLMNLSITCFKATINRGRALRVVRMSPLKITIMKQVKHFPSRLVLIPTLAGAQEIWRPAYFLELTPDAQSAGMANFGINYHR